MDVQWLLAMAAAGLLVRGGSVLYGSGLARSKFAAGAILRNFADFSIAALSFWLVGAAIQLAPSGGIFGFDSSLFLGPAGIDDAAPLMLLVMLLTATHVVPAAMAERSRFFPLWAAAALLGGVVLPVTGHWIWSDAGWLRQWGVTDIGGVMALHVPAGVCALVGAIWVGPRMGKYNRDRSGNAIPSHNVPLAASGVMLMLIGWIPYLLGSAMLHGGATFAVASNTLLAACAGGVVALLVGRWRYGKPEVSLTFSGILGAMVAVSGCAAETTAMGGGHPLAIILIGAAAGLIVPLATVSLDLMFKVDDPSGLIAVHLCGGIWGAVAGAFVIPADFFGRIQMLGNHVIALAAIIMFAAVMSIALFALLRRTCGLRVSEADEFDGLDLAEHDINAYPDFQQTMIKSYHLREA